MTHPLAQMPQYWGWIPHLDISFQRTVPEFEFADTLRELMGDFPNGVCVNVRDHQTKGSIPSFDGTVRLTFSNLDRFHYDDGSSLIAEVSLGPEHRDVVSTSVSMMSDETRDRELRSLGSIRDNFPKTVLTMDSFGLGTENGIRVVNVLDWLLDRKG